MKYLLIIFLSVFSFNAFSADCLRLGYKSTRSDGTQQQVVYFEDNYDVNSCPESSTYSVLVTSTDYQSILTGGTGTDVLITQEQFEEYELLKSSQSSGEQLITPLDIAGSFTWGFGTYITFWYIGFSIRVARRTIRQM